MAAVEHARQVHRDDLVPGVERNVPEIALRAVDAGAVDQDVDVAVALEDRLRGARHFRLVGDVERDRLAAARRLQLLLACRQRFAAAPGDHHVRAGLGELDAAREPDARAPAGDPGHLTV